MMASAVKVGHESATRRELAFAQMQLDCVIEQLDVMKKDRVEPPTSLKRQRVMLEAEISTLISDLEG